MILYAHLNKEKLDESLLSLKNKLMVIYLNLATKFFQLLIEAKHSNSMKSMVLLIQAIKQATMPKSVCQLQNSVPHIQVQNTTFHVDGETKVYIGSYVKFHFYVNICNTNNILLQDNEKNWSNFKANYIELLSTIHIPWHKMVSSKREFAKYSIASLIGMHS